MHEFASIEEVESVLNGLMQRDQQPLVQRMPRQTGQKEARFIHLLTGVPESKEINFAPPPESARLQVITENERIAKLEEQVKTLQAGIDELQQRFSEFKKQFE
jgi:uncharacterized protein YceH (UPF0502 family)